MKKIKMVLLMLFAMSCSYGLLQGAHEPDGYTGAVIEQACLHVQDIRDAGMVLTLDDGSEWDIKYFGGGWRLLGWGWTEQRDVSHWTAGDIIEVRYPGSGNFMEFVLLLTNRSRKEEAVATLKTAPSVDCEACLWVTEFDRGTNLVTLSDGTAWLKTATDMYRSLFSPKNRPQNAWEPGDAITLIRSEGWLTSKDVFLWNHETNEMPYVKCVKNHVSSQ